MEASGKKWRAHLSGQRVETVVAALLAAVCVLIALSRGGGARELGPKHLVLQAVGVFREPTFLTQPPSENHLLFVTGRFGTVWILKDGIRQPSPFLEIRNLVNAKGHEQGLFSIAFAPDYSVSGRFYVAYTARGAGELQVEEFRRSATDKLRADPASARPVLAIHQNSLRDHGGLLLFGPGGDLYIGTGDGGPANDPFGTAQNKTSLLGKIIRIDPRQRAEKPYTVPPDNPFVGVAGARPEIYAYGLHNPWRFSFDTEAGTLAIGDTGQSRYEEIDILPATKARGANFGWSAYEGFGAFKGGVPRTSTVLPTLAYPHTHGCAVVGGYVVRDQQLAHIKGREVVRNYLFGDLCTGRLRTFKLGPDGQRIGGDHSAGLRVPRLTSFAADQSGRLYALSLRGPVYRIVATRHR